MIMANVKKPNIVSELLDKKIKLRCYYGPVHGGMKISPVKNPKTQQYASCVRKVDSEGNIIYGPNDNKLDYFVKTTDMFDIKDGIEFDLTSEVGKKQWEAIKFSSLINDNEDRCDERGEVIIPGSSNFNQAFFYVERLGKEAKIKNTKRRDVIKAQNYIIEATLEDAKIKAKILGKKNVTIATSDEIEDFLMEQASVNPEKVINLFTGGDTKLYLLFLDSRDKNILINKGGIYFYLESMIGRDADSCVSYFKNPVNKRITDLIIKDTWPEQYKAMLEAKEDKKDSTI